MWSLGTFHIWLIARHRLLVKGHPDIPVGHRGMLELARAMTEEIGHKAEDLDKLEDSDEPKHLEALCLTNETIEKILNRLGGGNIRLPDAGEAGFVREELPVLPGNLVWLDVSLLLWSGVMLVTAAGQSGRLAQDIRAWIVIVFGSAALAAAVARAIGPTRRWRIFLVTLLWLFCFLVGAVVTVTEAYKVQT